MFHTSALGEQHAIPTTYQITKAAAALSFGARTFPSSGLTIEQFGETIKAMGLQPMMVEGQVEHRGSHHPETAFRPERFSNTLCGLLRAGYPVLITGTLYESDERTHLGRHAVCAVGFREPLQTIAPSGEARAQDTGLEYIYIHNDNIGPNVRYRLQVTNEGTALLRPSRPARRIQDQVLPSLGLKDYNLVPGQLIVAVHDRIRLHIESLQRLSLHIADLLAQAIEALKPEFPGFQASARYIGRYN